MPNVDIMKPGGHGRVQAGRQIVNPMLVGAVVGLLHGRMTQSEASPLDTDHSRFADLVEAVALRRDGSAFKRLFEHYAPRLKAYFRRLGADAAGAEELAQDVMVTLWNRADQFDRRRATVATWLFAIARNRRIDVLRRERRPEIDHSDPLLVPAGPDLEATAVSGQTEARLRQALAELPAEQALLVRRSFFDDQPHGAIAAELDLPLGTVKSRLRLALVKLRAAMKEEA